MPELEIIDLADLRLSELNPRATPPGDAEVAALAASIAEVGLLQGLCGYGEPGRQDIVHVTAGGLRLRALQHLAAIGRLPEEMRGIPVLVHDSPAEAAAAAVAENEARRAMGPGDQYRAIAQLRAAGRSRPQIAAALATDEAQVARILALDRAAPEVLDALSAGTLTLDQARAFTVGPPDLQAVLLRNLAGGSPWASRPEQIRSSLRDASGAGHLALLLDVVTRAAYTAAGGTITTDLFSDVETIEDPALLRRLFDTHVAARCAQLRAEGWAWAELVAAPLDFEMLEGAEAEPTEAEAEFLAAHGNDRAEDEPEEITRRRAGILERLDAGSWTPDQMSVAGVALVLGRWHGLQEHHGCLRAEDVARAREFGLLDEGGEAEGGGEAGNLSAATNTGCGSGAGPLSAALTSDLTSLRAVVLAEAVAAEPELALDVLDWLLARPIYPVLTTLTAQRGNQADAAALGIDCRVDWPDRARFADSGPPFRRAGTAPLRRARNARLARWIAGTLTAGTGTDPWAEVMAAAEIHVRDRWTPDAQFFDRLTMAQLAQVWREIAGPGEEPLEAAILHTAGRKADAVAHLAGFFAEAGTDPRPSDLAARVRSWLPEPIRPEETPCD